MFLSRSRIVHALFNIIILIGCVSSLLAAIFLPMLADYFELDLVDDTTYLALYLLYMMAFFGLAIQKVASNKGKPGVMLTYNLVIFAAGAIFILAVNTDGDTRFEMFAATVLMMLVAMIIMTFYVIAPENGAVVVRARGSEKVVGLMRYPNGGWFSPFKRVEYLQMEYELPPIEGQLTSSDGISMRFRMERPKVTVRELNLRNASLLVPEVVEQRIRAHILTYAAERNASYIDAKGYGAYLAHTPVGYIELGWSFLKFVPLHR